MVSGAGERRRGRPISGRRSKRQNTNRNSTFLCPNTGTKSLRNSSIAQRNLLLADLHAAKTAREGAVTGKTHADQARAWTKWKQWCGSIGVDNDVLLDGFTRHQRLKLIGAFAMALRSGRFSRQTHGTLVEGTVRGAISYVAQTFRDEGRPNPTRDEDGELGRILSRQFRAFRNEDPNPTQQKAIPPCVIGNLAKKTFTETQRAISQLSIGAYFFACRSCEYLKVAQANKRRTDILRLRNVLFIKGGWSSPTTNHGLNTQIAYQLHSNGRKRIHIWIQLHR